MPLNESSPIVLLDSGLGGLTVARELRRALPDEELLYFGDTARVPYGSRTPATIKRFVREIVSYFQPRRPKQVVIACNTATALALPEIRGEFPELNISGVIEPGANAAIEAVGGRYSATIGVIATDGTIRSRAYERAILRRCGEARVIARSTPLLVPIIEEGRGTDDPLVHLALRQYLSPMLEHGIDALVLGCTHYPVLKQIITEIVGTKVRVIDAAERCAQDVAASIRQRGLTRIASRGGNSGSLRCFVTDDPTRFARLASRFVGEPIEPPRWVAPEDLVAAAAVPGLAPLIPRLATAV